MPQPKHTRKLRRRLVHLSRTVCRVIELLRYAMVRPRKNQSFHIVSSERNAGEWAIRCLESVHAQRYDRSRIRHIVIDDASDDGTHEAILGWLGERTGHRVEYIHNRERVGGTVNNLTGFRMAEPGSVVIELNGDDWLPDPGLLHFLNRVYAKAEVWMTYNSQMTFNAGKRRRPKSYLRPLPREVVAAGAMRDHPWHTAHLHTFRAELFAHVREENLIDPATGRHWANADDLALYWSLLELAGSHSRHIHRVTCVKNLTNWSESRDESYVGELVRRIRLMPKHEPLRRL